MAEYTSSIDIEATPDVVFGYLITNDTITTWMGQWADLDPTPGGRFAVDIAGHPVRGEFLEIDPPRRLVVSWGFAGDTEVPPGSSTVAFTLSPITAGTRVELRHSGLPDAALAGHAAGWEHFVPRLATAAIGVTPAADTWQPSPSPDVARPT